MEKLLIQQVIEGDISKFSFFIDSYKDMAYTIAFRIVKDSEDAEEIVQDSFLKAYNSLKKFRHDSKFSTWLYKIVVNSSLSRVSQRKMEVCEIDLSQASQYFIENVESVYKNLVLADQRKQINIALDSLGPEDKLLLTLYYLCENTIDEVVEMTGIKADNVKMKLHRARKKMYIILEKLLKTESLFIL